MSPQGSREMFIEEDEFDNEYVPKKKKRKPKGKDLDRLEQEAVEQVNETKTNNGVVWYEGIVDDLKIVTAPGDEWSDVEWKRRREMAEKLRSKGIKLPLMSVDEKDRAAYENRLQIQSAIDYLNPLFVGKYRREAVTYLNNMGIGAGEGVPFLPGSEESKRAEQKDEGVDLGVKEHEEYLKKERRANVMNWLTALSISKDEGEREDYLSALEENGIKIKQFLEGMEKAVPGRLEDVMRQLRAVVEVWKMDEMKKREFPTMTKIANNYAHVLGLE